MMRTLSVSVASPPCLWRLMVFLAAGLGGSRLAVLDLSNAFILPAAAPIHHPHLRPLVTQQTAPFLRPKPSSSSLSLSSQQEEPQQQYDISRPVFDLYALRRVRGDALTKYNSLNQSEPLRINLSLLLGLSLAASPWLAPEVNGGVALTLPQTAAAAAASLACGALLVRECQSRRQKLTRLEKELQALSLTVQLPTNVLADRAFADRPVSVMSVLKNENARLVAVCGPSASLQSNDTLVMLTRVLRRRLRQAHTYVVVVPTTDTTTKDDTAALLSSLYEEPNGERLSWLAKPADLDAWREYFASLSATSTSSSSSSSPGEDSSSSSFRWFGLTPSGRSFGSGSTEPSWLQVFGKSLSPVEALDEDDADDITASTVGAAEILQCQKQFYDALTNGKLDVMTERIMDGQHLDEQVSSVMQQGGRLEAWDACLQEGARPAGMKISGGDCWQVDDTTAYSTCVEFPTMSDGGTLLAVQKWRRASSSSDWKLQLHQTIPWTANVPAAGTLICDCRGCVSLVRTK